MYEYTLNDIENHLEKYKNLLINEDQYEDNLNVILLYNEINKERLIFIYDACKKAFKELGAPKAIQVHDGKEDGIFKFDPHGAIIPPCDQELINKIKEILLKNGAKIT
jgi:hypothetical protein